jgi:hypothetical protein
MLIDYKEIAQANKGGGQQDEFELFSRDFLKSIGYKILRHPDRGADGKKDLIVSETRKGVGGETTINWLVSCKHYAHSGNSVSDSDELDIADRIKAHQCQGFIGVYSTLPAASLSNKLFGMKDDLDYIIYDSARIEELIIENKPEQMLLRYFPKSYIEYSKRTANKKGENNFNEKSFTTTLTEKDILRISKTAIIIMEIEKIKTDYWEADWAKRNEIIEQLYKYIDHSNPIIEQEVFEFLSHIASMTRAKMSYASTSSVYWTALNFFPSLYDEENMEQGIQNAKRCINIGHNIVYDSFIHLRNLAIAQWGFSLLKYVYRLAKENNIQELIQEVNKKYDELEYTLRRPERNDLGNAQELTKIFRSDLEEWDLGFPELPDKLQGIVYVDEKK